MKEHWDAVSAAIRARLDEQGMTMTDLAGKSGTSLTTVRELVHVLNTRRRQPRTLSALSEALGWPANHLGKVLRGQTQPIEAQAPSRDGLETRLRAVEARLTALEQRLSE